MKKIIYYAVCAVHIVATLAASASLVELEKAGKQLLTGGGDQKKIFLTEVESQQEALDSLREAKASRERESKAYLNQIQAEIAQVNSQISRVKESLKHDSENELLSKKLSLLDERHDVLKKREQSWKQVFGSIEQHIKQLSDYLGDLDLKKFKESRFESKQIYSFEDLQDLYQIILDQEKEVDHLIEQEKNAATELENRRRAATVTLSEFKKKKEDREKVQKEADQEFILDPEELNELWILNEKLFEEKKKLDELEIEESENKLELIKLKLFVARRQLDTLKKLFREVKPSVRVSEADVSVARDELAKKKQKSNVSKRNHYQAIEEIENQLQKKRAELELLSRRYNVALSQDLDKWTKDPKQTVDSYVSTAQVGKENDKLLLLQRKKDYFKALLDLEDEKIRHDEISIRIKETFHKIRYRKFVHEDELAQAIKKYDMLKAGLKASLSSYQDKKNAAAILLEEQKKAQENVKEQVEHIKEQKDTLFKDNVKEFNRTIGLLTEVLGLIKEQIDIINKIIETYADTISILTNTSKKIEFISAELGSITIWHRPEHAVSWQGLSNTFSDLQTFIFDLRSYLTLFSFERIGNILHEIVHSPLSVFLFIVKFLGALIGLFLLRVYLPRLMNYLRALGNTYPLLRIFSFILVFLGGFFIRYFAFIVPWLLTFIALTFSTLPDPYIYILFYLFSIVYLLYLAQRFIAYFIEFNEQHNFVFVNKEFQPRFVLVFSVLLYATIIIVFFREAFILGNYPRSELPTILLAVNFIILQIALISLISKEQILSLIPKHTDTWEWIYEQIDDYYYLLVMVVIAIIIMSNPYVGFGRLVLYVLRRVVYTVGLVVLLVWVHQLIKKWSSHLFFSSDEDDISKERFDNAKTWYGFAVILIFLAFTIVGLIFAAKIWGWPEQLTNINQLSDIKSWLQKPFLHAGKDAPISIWTILVLIMFALIGAGIALAVNRFVLWRIFDILLVDSGVQHTVSSIVYYFVFIMAIFLGFSAANLGELVIYIIGALILGIGWVIKDPISDFVSYFVILVQRPLKVGDFIKIDDNLLGVVRKITPRTVILRRRNSNTIILPNSYIVNKPITNWNYVRGFIAHEDILVTVSYKSDPAKTYKILHEVLAENSYILKNPKPVIRLSNFSDDGYVFLVRGFLSSNYTLDQWDIASDIRIAIVKALRMHQIEIAVPTRIIVNFDNKRDADYLIEDMSKNNK